MQLIILDFDCPQWYKKNFVELKNPQKFCKDYWDLVMRYSTFREALEARKMRWVLYSVYVVQRERKMRWEAIESVLIDYEFPKRLYCKYMYLLWFTGRLSRIDFEAAVDNVNESLVAVDLPITEHWTTQYLLELNTLEGD